MAVFLDERGFRHALIGALALAAYGLPRATVDLDLVVDAEAQDAIVEHLEQRGYETVHRSPGYSNHVHPDPSSGRVDFVYIDRDTADALFSAARAFPGPAGRTTLLPRPEHLAAMKVLAIKNDPTRTFQDLADIRFLLTLPGVNREEVRGYFAKHGLEGRFDDLEKTL